MFRPQQALRAGAFHCRKPYRPAELIETIHRALALDAEQRQRHEPQAS
jgi:FixJ family two-component response regulator